MGKSQGSKRVERVAIGDPVSDNGISVCDFCRWRALACIHQIERTYIG